MQTKNLSTLKIHKLTQAQYDREVANGTIDEDALYLTPDEERDLSDYATKDELDAKANIDHIHDDRYYTETEIDEQVATLNSSISAKADTNHNHNEEYDVLGAADTALASAKSYTDTKASSLASTSVVDNKISSHNTSTSAHNDIRVLISDLTTKLNNFLDVDDATTDQLSEVLALINNNKGTLESLTTSKINVSDIVNNLTTNSASKVLSAAQGVAIKSLIDILQTELDSHTHSISDVAGLQSALDGKASTSHGTHVSYSATVPVMDGTASVGSASTVARSDHRHPTDTSRAAQTDLDALKTVVAGKASSTHIHSVAVTGANASSSITGTVTVPTVNSTQKYLSATNSAPDVAKITDTVLGTGTTFTVSGGTATTTNLKATASGTAVGANGTASAITGFGEHTTDTALGANATFSVNGGTASTSKMVTTTVNNPTVSAVTIPNVTGNTSVTASKVSSAGSKTNGTAAFWSASVSDDGVLSFSWTTNTPTAVTLPTFSDVTATNTTLGTALSASKVSTSGVTVATGSLASTGAGASVATGVSAISVAVNNADPVEAITALGAPTKSTVLTGVKVTSQPTVALSTGATAGTGVVSVATGISGISVSASGDNVTALTGIEVGAPSITLTNNSSNVTGSVPVVSGVSIDSISASVTGTAAAQKWTQSDGATGAPQ